MTGSPRRDDPDCDYSHLAHANDLEPSIGHRHLRERCPLHREVGHEPAFHVVSRHEDVFEVITDPDRWGNGQGVGVFVQTGGVTLVSKTPPVNWQLMLMRGEPSWFTAGK